LYGHIKAKNYDLKYLGSNYDALYRMLVPGEPETKDYPNTFPFWNLSSTMQELVFAGVEVNFLWGSLTYSGSSDSFEEWFREWLYPYCRVYWSTSPEIAVVDILDSGDKFVMYTLSVPYDDVSVSAFFGTDYKKISLPEVFRQVPGVVAGVSIGIDKDIELEREKQNTIKIKTSSALSLIEKGFSPEQIMRILGI
jgi:hypothetical protein